MSKQKAPATSESAVLDRFYGVIPAGGVGTRLWPLSRAAAPKFLHDLTGSGSTLIRATYDRLRPLSGDRVMVVTGALHRQAVRQQLPEIANKNLVLELEPKDSAAAIGLAAAILYKRDPQIIMGSFAADQVIAPVDVFQEAVREAVHTAAQGYIVTIGIQPTHPSTGFGYIRAGEPLKVAGAPSAASVVEFVEKPSADVAQTYLDSGSYSWNAGMFVAPVDLMLKHLEANEPVLYTGLMEIAEAWDTTRRREVVRRIWPTLPKIAIDYAVAEPAAAAGDVAMIPGAFSWDDVGDFAAIGRLNPAEENSDLTVMGEGARVYSENASGIVVSDTKRVIALIGIEDVVIVDTPDALLVTTKEHAQEVKKAVEHLKASGDTDVL
ncbi:NTP transferase domain-containing protein [Arthrobacter sp. zg-Y40]|uniref:mannose-1-phosphate guanylyltransferase n=1 Tax=unclassified Arthrobacter TaxID=235627 RepID=UPI001D138667|nr:MULTISPECIES: mannose-1-phosphate guanylyltransferase [unclassified Arthrobacter]MCC3277316.1 NTP transferase domain-containing protein [Arthrobacter sp. zg-Y20]MCC3280083.1 NTP transferase domain-containing protein [Arthrobacter sp. zg-Y40]MDK1317476.1 mannose-1-phosphate guanylyltransferase [Arthrobacter sp. zg.Y20]MDK1328565.1 mannose-1-phosphate guanylyltransferase [Arthrobacter sp. zg-Y1143]WIB07021.1 mannose-1-phosphate guanylyltransferase [Arthrobacter sp. zg-Y20]